MRQTALRDKTQQNPRGAINQSRSLVAPVKGWYVGSPLAAAPEQTAYLLENAFPEIDYVRARGGSMSFATGMGSFPVNTLMPYRALLSGNNKMFASCNGSIYDVTAGGPVGAALVTGLSTASFSFIQFSGAGVQTLLAANGVDPVQLYNGTTWGTTPAFTGPPTISYLFIFRHNIWGFQPNSLDAWYGAIDAIGGAMTKYPMSPLFRYGGALIAGGTWTLPTSVGLEVSAVFITDQGEVAIFAGGTTPADWTLQGVYKIPPPVGPNCTIQSGADMGIMTMDGIIAMSEVQNKAEIALQNTAVTAAIRYVWQKAALDRVGIAGWQIVAWASKAMVVVNVPQLNAADRTQFIANGRTGAWCRYFGWDARCFAIGGTYLEKLFYGTSSGVVMQAEVGGQDNLLPYTMTIFSNFTDLSKTDIGFPSLSQSAERKQVKQIRPRMQTNGSISPKITVNVDFDISVPSLPAASAGPPGGAAWDVAKWNVDVWPATPSTLLQDWRAGFGIGAVVAPIIQITFHQTALPDVRLTTTDILFEAGNLLG